MHFLANASTNIFCLKKSVDSLIIWWELHNFDRATLSVAPCKWIANVCHQSVLLTAVLFSHVYPLHARSFCLLCATTQVVCNAKRKAVQSCRQLELASLTPPSDNNIIAGHMLHPILNLTLQS